MLNIQIGDSILELEDSNSQVVNDVGVVTKIEEEENRVHCFWFNAMEEMWIKNWQISSDGISTRYQWIPK